MHEDPSTQPLPAAGGWLLGGRYRVLDRLGSGGMAEVFRAHDEQLDRDVAVKVFRTAVDDADTQGEQRRELELQSLAHLNHPNLITLYDASLSGDGPGYLVLELVAGPDLATRLHDGPVPEPEVRQLGAQIADALAYVHARGLVHRDVKPANILLSPDGRARLSDFGIVRMVGSARMTAVDLTLGTASYVAPEQARGANVGPAADVYALGLVLIEALTGSRCFDGPMHEALAARLTRAPHVPSSLPAPWPALLTAMTATDPAARPPASAVSSTLSAAPSGAIPAEWRDTPHHSTLIAPPVAPDEPRRRRGPFLAAAAIACAAIVAGAGFLLAHQTETPGTGTTSRPPTHPATRSTAPATQHTSATQAARVAPTHRASTPKAKHTPPGKKKHPVGQPKRTPTPTTSAPSTAVSGSPPATGVVAP